MREPVVYDYLNPIRFLHDRLAYKQATEPNEDAWTGGAVAQRAGVTRGALVNILKGRRKPNSDTVHALGLALGLNGEESNFLVRLAELHRSRPGEPLRKAAAAVFESEQWRAQRELSDAQLTAVDSWMLFALRDLVQLPGFREEPAWISARLGNRIGLDQVGPLVEQLLMLGLVERGAHGALRTVTRVHTGAEVHGPSAYDVHRSALELAGEALERVPPQERYFGITSLALPRSALPAARDRVFGFLTDMANFGDAQDAEAEELVQLQVQLFRLESGEEPR